MAETVLDGMVRGPVECFRVVRSCAQTLTDAGFEMPPWRRLARMWKRCGGQSRAKRAKVWVATEGLSGVASSPLTAVHMHRMTKIDPQLFRVVLRRRLGLPLPLSSRTCRCGRLLDSHGHHRAACSEAGVPGKKGVST